ncbi:DUF3231 family protein [Virgibacillus oceani]
MGILSGNPKDEPMHYGEVYSVWSSLMATEATIAGNQTLHNHAGDEDLRMLIKETIQQGQQHVDEIKTLLQENGVGLPPTPPERPQAQLEDIPAGARFMDQEIAASISAEIAAGMVTCSKIMGQAIREDIAMTFGQFHTQKATLAGKFLQLNKEKGWLVPPPLHHHKTEEK